MKRIDGRTVDQLREIEIVKNVNPYAEGSVEVRCGKTKLLITASVEKDVPRWMAEESKGWITAEYGMLPRATHDRNRREAAAGKQSGRTMEIQRLVGRALRQAVGLEDIPGVTIRIDCDVLCADGGTRTAAISGGWVALSLACKRSHEMGFLSEPVSLKPIAAISAGVVSGQAMLDLCYEEDSNADFDLNFVFSGEFQKNNIELVDTANFNIVEIQGTAEGKSISTDTLMELIELGKKGVSEIVKLQTAVLQN